MKKLSFSLLILVYTVVPLYSQELSQFEVEHSNAMTSDKLSLKTYTASYRNHRREMFYPYENEASSAIDFGLTVRSSTGTSQEKHFDETFVMPFFGKKFSENLSVDAGVGISSVKDEDNSDRFNPFFISTNLALTELFMTFGYFHRNTILEMRYPNAFIRDLKTHLLEGTLLWTPKKWRVRLYHRSENLSDENKATYYDFDLKYNFSFSNVWLLIGAGYELYENKDDINGYWTPSHYYSYGPRVETTFAIWKNYSFNFGGSYNFLKDENQNYGEGHYLNASLMTDDRNKNHFELGFERVKSVQKKNLWFINRPYLSYTAYW